MWVLIQALMIWMNYKSMLSVKARHKNSPQTYFYEMTTGTSPVTEIRGWQDCTEGHQEDELLQGFPLVGWIYWGHYTTQLFSNNHSGWDHLVSVPHLMTYLAKHDALCTIPLSLLLHGFPWHVPTTVDFCPRTPRLLLNAGYCFEHGNAHRNAALFQQSFRAWGQLEILFLLSWVSSILVPTEAEPGGLPANSEGGLFSQCTPPPNTGFFGPFLKRAGWFVLWILDVLCSSADSSRDGWAGTAYNRSRCHPGANEMSPELSREQFPPPIPTSTKQPLSRAGVA